MAKTIIIDSLTGSRVPFLRGILARSLADSGMEFENAYALSSKIRSELEGTKELPSLDLRSMVNIRLQELDESKTIQRYLERSLPKDQITITSRDGHRTPFSKSAYQRTLESCGLTTEQALLIIELFLEETVNREQTDFQDDQLAYYIYKLIAKELGKKSAHNYLVWKDFLHSGRPLLLLIGGTTGCGKSTIATEAAHSLEVVRIQSTDMLREVMRIMVPPRLMPTLHCSSFSSWQGLPKVSYNNDKISEDVLIDGFNMQAEQLSVASEAVVSRALRERVSLILEGVHIKPSFLEKIPAEMDATVVMVMLGVLKQKQLRDQITGRGKIAPDRRGKRYIKHFDNIWKIQTYLLDEADRCNVPIVINDQKDDVIPNIMKIIISSLAKDFDKSPKEVFRRVG